MRPALAHITAALDADPFADPVNVCGVELTRAQARRFERELVATNFPSGRAETAGDRSNGDTGHIAKLKSAHFHAVEVSQP